jgi:hypothetical protein
MMINKWTLGLAAAGLVSVPVASLAEEKPNQVLTALQGTSISGYVDTSAQWNFGTGNANNPPYKFGGANKADGFNLNVVQLRIEKPMDEAEWAAGYRVDLWFGPDANTLGTTSTTSDESSSDSDFAIRQAYVALRTPVGNGIDWKMGVFDTIIGYESVEGPVNPNYTRSYGHSIEPQTHTGLLASYRFADWVSASAGVANTVGPSINQRAFDRYNDPDHDKAESYKTYMASVTLTAPDKWGWASGSTLYGGVVNGFNDNENGSALGENTSSYYAGLTLNTPWKGIKIGAAFDYLNVHSSDNYAWALGGYVSYQATEKLSFHVRGEYVRADTDDFGGTFFGTDKPKVVEVTATVQYDLWANVLSRLEFRWDHAANGEETFGEDSNGNADMKNAFMLAANIIYKF